MNVSIFRDAMVIQRQNDQKVVNRIRAKAQYEWDKFVIVGQ